MSIQSTESVILNTDHQLSLWRSDLVAEECGPKFLLEAATQGATVLEVTVPPNTKEQHRSG